jgi:hypothetical protein
LELINDRKFALNLDNIYNTNTIYYRFKLNPEIILNYQYYHSEDGANDFLNISTFYFSSDKLYIENNMYKINNNIKIIKDKGIIIINSNDDKNKSIKIYKKDNTDAEIRNIFDKLFDHTNVINPYLFKSKYGYGKNDELYLKNSNYLLIIKSLENKCVIFSIKNINFKKIISKTQSQHRNFIIGFYEINNRYISNFNLFFLYF